MSDITTPNDSKKFTLVAFIAFAVVFVFVMLMMLWHGNYEHAADGEMHYDTKIITP